MATNLNAKTPRYPVHFLRGVIMRLIDPIRRRHGDNPDFTPDMRRRLDYIEAVLLHGNTGGRKNETIELPNRYNVRDVESVLGVADDWPPASGSDAAWRGVRKHFDLNQNGRNAGGRA